MNQLSQLAVYYTHYGYNYSYTDGTAVSAGLVASVFFAFFIIFLAVYALHAYLLSRIFKKAGLSRGIAWIPFYNTWKLLELGGQPGFWAVLGIITPLNIVTSIFVYISMYHISLRFGKTGSWVILAIFFPTIWMAILAFDNSKWQTKAVKA